MVAVHVESLHTIFAVVYRPPDSPDSDFSNCMDKLQEMITLKMIGIQMCTASANSHASGKIKNHYIRILRMESDVFFDAESESPHMT